MKSAVYYNMMAASRLRQLMTVFSGTIFGGWDFTSHLNGRLAAVNRCKITFPLVLDFTCMYTALLCISRLSYKQILSATCAILMDTWRVGGRVIGFGSMGG